jgi:GT2 family glycosyltransferase
MKRVSIVTVNFNQSVITEELLNSIAITNTYQNIEIIVVDNGCTVNSVPEWSVKYPDIRFIRSDKNLGFAGGNNIGIEIATGDYLFLVNNDTEFTPGLIQTLVNVLDEHPEVGIVSPKIRYFDKPDTLQYMGFTAMDYKTARNSSIGQFEVDKGQYDNLTGPTGYAHGAAMMVKRECIEKAGLNGRTFFSVLRGN